jgi:ribosomal protein S18 acetylase RimI-like enzyme
MVMETVTIDEAPADGIDVRWCFERYVEELDARLAGGFDVAAALPLGLEELTPPRGLVLLARRAGQPVGCGALKLSDPGVAELKRLWVDGRLRGRGIGRRLLDELERRAGEAGRRLVRLDSNGALVEALALYRSSGYREVAPFNAEPFADHWFEKRLEDVPSPGTCEVGRA